MIEGYAARTRLPWNGCYSSTFGSWRINNSVQPVFNIAASQIWDTGTADIYSSKGHASGL